MVPPPTRHLGPFPSPCCLPSGSRVASSSLVAVRGGRATLTVSKDSRTAASSQAHEAIPLVGASAPHTPLLHLPLDTDPIWGGPPNHQLQPGRPVTHWNSPNHLGWEVKNRERGGGKEGGGGAMIEEVDRNVNREASEEKKENKNEIISIISTSFSPLSLF